MVSSSFSAGMTIDSSGSATSLAGSKSSISGIARAGASCGDEGAGAHIRPACMSGIIASIDWRSASRVLRSQRQPSARMRSVSSRTIGTSPFQPRSPPV